VFYLSRNATVKPGQKRGEAAQTLRNTLLQSFDLTIEYQYEIKTNMLQLLGVAKFSDH
jgi:hypothetical protein